MAGSIFSTKPLIFMTSRTAPILVVACGNPDAADDAFGPNVIAALSTAICSPPGTQGGDTEGGNHLDLHKDLQEQCPDLEALNLGLNPAVLLDHLPGREMLILLDAVSLPDPSNTTELIELQWPADRQAIETLQCPRSTHGFSITAQLDLADSLGFLPQCVHLILAPTQNFDLGAQASIFTQNRVGKALERIKILCAVHMAAR